MKHIKLLTLLIMAGWAVSAQNETDALRYAYTMPIGTSKFTGFGGAIGASGADLTSMSFNPAGTGIYRHSEANMTLAWTNNNLTSVYHNRQSISDQLQVHVGNMGFVVTTPSLKNSDWKFVNFGFSYNQLANYNAQMIIEGKNPDGSYLVPETNDVNYGNDNPSDNLFVQSDLIYLPDGSSNYVNDYQGNLDNGEYNASQDYKLKTSGNLGEYAINLGTNYADWLFLGATLGIQHINYEQRSVFYEETPDNIPNTRYFEYEEYFRTKGTGFNFKTGIIIKPLHILRLGFAFHTPTFFNLTDYYYNNLSATIDYSDGRQTNTAITPDTYFNWNYTSPMKLITSGSIVLGSFLMLNVDYEWVNYNKMNLSSDDDFFENENQKIRDSYKTASNVKLGTEVRLGIMSLRGGLSYFGSPYESGSSNENAYNIAYSGGVGIKSKHVYFDVAYRYYLNESNYYIYETPDSQAEVTLTNQMFMATLGYRF